MEEDEEGVVGEDTDRRAGEIGEVGAMGNGEEQLEDAGLRVEEEEGDTQEMFWGTWEERVETDEAGEEGTVVGRGRGAGDEGVWVDECEKLLLREGALRVGEGGDVETLWMEEARNGRAGGEVEMTAASTGLPAPAPGSAAAACFACLDLAAALR